MKELVVLSKREMRRLRVMEQVSEGALSLAVGAEVLRVSYRQAKRLPARYRGEGPSGLAYRHRGRPAGRGTPSIL
jgi:hypothetical protein